MAERIPLVELLQAGLKGTALRGQVIANNIANLDTPGYQRKAVDFESCLQEALDSPKSADLSAAVEAAIIELGGPADASGNGVDLDVEVGQMVQNGALQKTYLKVLAKTYRQMELAMAVE
jgi:flagellar basal-body rod protein FlgB